MKATCDKCGRPRCEKRDATYSPHKDDYCHGRCPQEKGEKKCRVCKGTGLIDTGGCHDPSCYAVPASTGGERCDICQCLHFNKNGYSEYKDCSCPAGRSIPPSTEGESGYNQKSETQEAPQCWYGSFGHGHRCSCGRNLVKCYAKLWGTYQECREMMHDRWGEKWCSLYDSGTGGYLQRPAWLDEFGIELLPQNCWDKTCHPASRETYEI